MLLNKFLLMQLGIYQIITIYDSNIYEITAKPQLQCSGRPVPPVRSTRIAMDFAAGTLLSFA